MEIHQLKYFVSLAQEKNFTRAAELCHVSQPSLSQQIKKLEEELGHALFFRTKQSVSLSPFGEKILSRTRLILSAIDTIREEASGENDKLSGLVRIGAIPTIAPYFLPQVVNQCKVEYPNMRIELFEDTTDRLVDELIVGNLDFAFLSPPLERKSELATMDIIKDELLICLDQEHPLASRKKINLTSLDMYPLVTMKDVHCLSQQSLALCRSSQISGEVAVQSAQLETVLSMIEAGLGFSFIPAMAVNSFVHRKVTFKSVSPQKAYRIVQLVWNKNVNLTNTQKVCGQVISKLGKLQKRS